MKKTYQIIEFLKIDSHSKLFLLFSVTNIVQDFISNCLENFPKLWHILRITSKYLRTVSTSKWPFLHSLILSTTIILYVDNKIGRNRSLNDFDKFTFT